MTEDLPSLIEQHKKDIWEWKQKESQWIKYKNQLDGSKRIIEELSTKIVELGERVREVEEENLKLIKKTQEAIGEMTIVKGIGMNSPEMRAVQKSIKEKDELIQELRMRIRDMLLISEQHRSILGDEITHRKRLQKEIRDLKVQMSEYMSVRTSGAGSVS